MRFALSAILWSSTCLGCATARYDGMPYDAAGMTYCDAVTGRIRSVIDAQLLLVDSAGGIHTIPALAEILVHERVHRIQLEARRPSPGACPKAYRVPELVQSELEAHCAGYGMAITEGMNPDSVAHRYAKVLEHHLGKFLASPVREFLAERWPAVCPGRPLAWDWP